MQPSLIPFTLHKRFALRISRGISAENTNFWIKISADGIEGWGEVSPFSIAHKRPDSSKIKLEWNGIVDELTTFHPLEQQKIGDYLQKSNTSSALRAGIDVALWDWLGKQVKLPLWRLWGLDRDRISPISVTVGINTPQGAKERLAYWQQILAVKIIKLKLGNPAGIGADRAMVAAIREMAPAARIVVDANGGWTLPEAIAMANWLAEQGVEYIEQPLAVGQESQLPELYSRSPLPIFVDESCFSSADITPLAHCVHGVNLKLMKTGGLSELQRAIAVARACGLQVMFGCYSDSTLANAAMAQLSPLADYLDLDSHLNLADDPFTGLILENGRLLPNNLPGLGVSYRASHP
jgi:L-alanine-DL-glutamate epimerase-like enolase superfamily enzyme